MYDERVKALRHCVYGDCADCNYRNHCADLAIEAADAIEELSAYVALYKDGGETAMKVAQEYKAAYIAEHDAIELLQKTQQPKWIPVTEQLPKERINPNTHDFEYVLCATIWGDVRPFKYGTPIGSKDAHFWNGAGYVDAYITHWMPLPQPPKEET